MVDLRNHNTLEHGLALEEGTDGLELEFGKGQGGTVSEVRVLLGDCALLEQRLGPDLAVLELDELVVLRKATKSGKSGTGFGLAAVVDEPTWGEWHEDHTDEEEDGGNELQAKRDEPSGILLAGTGASNVVGTVCSDVRM